MKISNTRKQKGSSLVEFAVVLPVLVMIVFGTIEFGLLVFNKQVITNASREGARAGIVARVPRASSAEITAVIQNYCKDHLITFNTTNLDPVTAFPDGLNTGALFGEDLHVQVTYQYDFLVIPSFIPGLNPFMVRADTLMKYE